MHTCQEIGVARVIADGVEERVHPDECHVEAVPVERLLEGVEGMVELVDAKIIGANLVSSAGMN
jgi:hypothetical protein